MKNIEDFIKDNKRLFDDETPGWGHEEKFMQLLNEQSRQKSANQFSRINTWLQVAAAILIVAGFTLGIISALSKSGNQTQQAESQLPKEVIEMENYYASLTEKKLNQIETLAGSGPEAVKVTNQLKTEIKNINQNSNALKAEYKKGTHDERLVNAIKNNYRILSGLLDKVVEQLGRSNEDSNSSNHQNKTSDFNAKMNNHENIIS